MKSIYAIFLVFTLWGCKSDDCEGMLASTGPAGFSFTLVDAFTGENLFTNGTYSPEQISIVTDENQELEYLYHSEPGFDLSFISVDLGFDEQAGNAYVKSENDTLFSFYFETKMSHEKCFSNISLKDIEFSVDSEPGYESGIYKIKL